MLKNVDPCSLKEKKISEMGLEGGLIGELNGACFER